MIRETMQTLNLGVKSLLLHKLRSSLTALGLLFGVASVIAMLAVGEGASHEALEQIKAMGSTNIMISSQKPPENSQSSTESVWSAVRYGLKYKDAMRIEQLLPTALHVVSSRHTQKDIRRGAFYANGIVVGTSPDYLDVVGMTVEIGRWISTIDVRKVENICVLGNTVAEKLFPLTDPIGETVRTGDNRFRVVGVLDYLGRNSGNIGPSLDSCVFIPITTSRKRYGDETTNSSGGSFSRERVELHEITVQLETIEEVEKSAAVLRTMLDVEKEINQIGDLQIKVPLELLRQAEASKRIFNIVLGSIAVISLLVGGIGIMNVMLATVTERTREIGVRRALGAKKAHIIYQFLVETVVLSGVGGILGVGLGLALPMVVEWMFEQKTIIRIDHVMLAFGISAGVGITFGIYPAWRAANMDPVEALRHE